jgi:hypothetical protein
MEKPSSEPIQDQLNSYIENKNAYLVLIKNYQWKIHTTTFDAYAKELDYTETCLLKLCKNYLQLVEKGVFVEPPVVPMFVPIGVCKKNDKDQWYVVSREFDTFLEQHPDFPWVWYRLSQNPNLSFQYVLDNPNLPWDWDWEGLSSNLFELE